MWKATIVACLKKCLYNSPVRTEKAVKNFTVIGVQPRFEPNTLLQGTNKFSGQPDTQNCGENVTHSENILEQT
jgi:hypothetical protein